MTAYMVTDVKEPVNFYHNGNSNNGTRYKGTGHKKAPDVIDRRVIAWDMEGMNLSGDDKPQHAVIFGNSVEPDSPLIESDLQTMEMLQYIADIGERYPHSIHVGFGFQYDANMLVKHLPEKMIMRLWRGGHCRFQSTNYTWNLSWIPGKTFTVTRYKGKHGMGKITSSAKTTVIIYDYSSFFGGKAFLPAAEDILRDSLSEHDRETIARGKAQRSASRWEDLTEVHYYWRREIMLIQRVFETFREVMYKAGFALKQWYGPGALANYINEVHGIRPKLGAVQITTGEMPDEVHTASKVAFSGGRFELFQAGRHEGPIHTIDINSAYPYALTMIPSLHPDEGQWRHVEKPTGIKRFGFYRISYFASSAKPFETRPMPLFWRDVRGLITYPNRVTGWYASPEARMVLGMPGVRVHEGWYWDSREEVWPWDFLADMYQTRMRLGKKNLLSIPFKLGPNSLYGKYAQTVGWNKKEKLPPRSHALPVAAWVTSYCRSLLWEVIRQIPDKVIAVETDSVFTTVDPTTLNLTIGDALGEWSSSTYDELLYLQSGVYHTRQGDEWNGTKSRGMNKAELNADISAEYLRSLEPGKAWKPLRVTTRPRFIGAGLAIASSAPFHDEHCVWRSQERDITLGEAGKRRHVATACQACQHGSTPWDEPHRLMTVSTSNGELLSHPRRLPWEAKQTDEVQKIRDGLMMEAELITR
jgi:hypothetical protein